MTVFMDTYGLIAWINKRDAAHQRVKSYLDSYAGSIVTTEWVLLEFADAFSLSSTKPFAIDAINRIHRLPKFLVVDFDPTVYQAGFNLYGLGQIKTGRLRTASPYGDDATWAVRSVDGRPPFRTGRVSSGLQIADSVA